MSAINDLILVLTSAEQQDFVRYLNARNKRKDTRNTDLFRALLAGTEERIKKEILPNAYNALSKRLMDRLVDFLANTTIENETTTEINVIKKIVVSRKLFSHNKYKIAYKIT